MHIWNDIVLAVNEQKVRWYLCMFASEYVIVRSPITPSQLHTHLHYNTRLCADVDGWIHGTVSCLLCLDEQQVRCYALVHVWIWMCNWTWYAMTRFKLHTRLPLNYNGYNTTRMLIQYMERCCMCWLWTNRKYVSIAACLTLNVSLFDYGAPWHVHLIAI